MKTTKQVVERLAKEYGLGEWEINLLKRIRKTRPKLHTVLRHVSGSGMLRVIDVYWLHEQSRTWITPLVAKLCDYPQDKKHYGLRVSGCGMDMGFSVVYNFSSAVFPDGFRYRKDEWHRNGDKSPVDKSGGYALKQEWL